MLRQAQTFLKGIGMSVLSSSVLPFETPAVLVFSQRPAAAQRALADESDLDEGVSSLGSLSVRLLAEWSKPRMMLGPPGWSGDPSAEEPIWEG